MKKIFSSRILLVCLFALIAIAVRADEEQDQIDILKSDASVPKKWQACEKLRVIGTAKAVPAVAAFLTDENLSQAARQALDGLPAPEADDALREALGKTAGALKAGVIDSIGWRGKADSVPLLNPLLSDADTNIAAAAANALGRIGGKDAIAALSAAKDNGPLPVEMAVQASLLQCAEHLTEQNDIQGAAAIYNGLNSDKYPLGIRTAAWRGLILTDNAHKGDLMKSALEGKDEALRKVALKVLRDCGDHDVVAACVAEWSNLPADAQLAALDAAVKQPDQAPQVVKAASESPDATLRMAAWTAVGELNDPQYIPALVHAAAAGKRAERDAARMSLAQLHGPNVSTSLLAAMDTAATLEKAELIRALGARPDANATEVLLKNAAAGDAPVRLASLEALKNTAPPQALGPLLDIAKTADSDDLREAAMDALSAVCQAAPDKEAAARSVLDVEKSVPAERQQAFMPLLAQLGTADALAVALEASHSQNADLAKEAVRALGQWPNAAPAQPLLDLANSATDVSTHTLALRGAIAASAQEPDTAKRLALLKQAMSETRGAGEKKDVLSQLGQIGSTDALDIAEKEMDDADVSSEAALAVLGVAEKLAPSNPDAAAAAAIKVLQKHNEGEFFQRAWALRAKSIKNAPFIRDWVVSGPYTRKGMTGATTVFKIEAGPEKKGQKVKWKPVASDDQVNLASIFPGKENCVAYLRTVVVAPDDCPAVLLMGSDDGIKAWLNGKVVHSHNVDRPQVVDEDAAPISLKKGPNELILKISQGGGGWGAVARIVGMDGNAIAGLQAERPTGAAGGLTKSN